MTPIPPSDAELERLYRQGQEHKSIPPIPEQDPALENLLRWNQEKAKRIAKLTAANEELGRENTRLKAPVSDEERKKIIYTPYIDDALVETVNNILASRATRTPPQEGQ
jgi:hypothetical protein